MKLALKRHVFVIAPQEEVRLFPRKRSVLAVVMADTLIYATMDIFA